jgi:hypothetical protein
MKAKAPQHSKMGDMARILKIHRVMAVGLMERMWHWAADEIPNGGIGKYEDATIAAQCWWPWPKRANEFIEAMQTVGFLDQIPTCRLYIHDWDQHCDDYVHMQLARRGERFANGIMPKLSRLSNDEKQRALSVFRAHCLCLCQCLCPLSPYPLREGGIMGRRIGSHGTDWRGMTRMMVPGMRRMGS